MPHTFGVIASHRVKHAEAYLTPTVGTVTTPDPGPLPNECTFVFKIRGPTGSDYNVIAAQLYGTFSFQIFRYYPNSDLYWVFYPDGSQYSLPVPPITGGDETFAMSFALDNGAGRHTGRLWTFDGSMWTGDTPFDVGPAVIPADSADPLQIGQHGYGSLFNGRIYSVELRTGLDPAAGTVLWRFDADEYPGTGTVYTDPRGRTWTLTNTAAITPGPVIP